MKKTLLSALIAATALVPVMASAQDGRRGNRGDGGAQAGGGREQRQAARAEMRAQRQAQPQMQRPQMQQANPNREAFRAQRQAERAGQSQQVRQPGFERDAMRAQRQAQRTAQPGVDFQQRGQAIEQRRGLAQRQGLEQRQWNTARPEFRQERRDDRQDFRQERREDRRDLANGVVTRQQYRNDRRDDRQDFRADRRDDARDFRRDQNRNGWNAGGNFSRGNDWNRGNFNRGNDWNRGNAFNRGGSWNRGNNWNRQWRQDDRYNWQAWRGQNRNAFRLPRYYAPQGYNFGYQRFGIGATLGAILFQQNYWINDPWAYRLPPVDGPFRWVRYYNDALLVDIQTGDVVDVINDIFW